MEIAVSHSLEPSNTRSRFELRTDAPSVAALDAEINARVARARSDAEVSKWLREKVRIKRRLVALPPSELETQAAAELDALLESA